MKLPDGNLDDLSQHAAMPVIEGEKWFGKLNLMLCHFRDLCFAHHLSLLTRISLLFTTSESMVLGS
jgi:hypothetical protein